MEQLVTAGIVNTMPEKTLDSSADHGRISGDTIRPFYQHAWDVMASLKQAGIDYDDVVRALEEEGVEKFETSWTELLETVDGELRKA